MQSFVILYICKGGLKMRNYRAIELYDDYEEEHVSRSYSIPGGLVILLIFMIVVAFFVITSKGNK